MKAVPEGIRDKECKRFPLQERPLVPYLPEKDPAQEMVSTLKNVQSLKTTIREYAELRLPIWHSGTREVFLVQVSTALDAIKKRGTFKAYKEAQEANVEQSKVAKQAKAALAILPAPTSKGKKESKKASGKKSSEKEKASQKIKESMALANTSAPELCKEYQTIYYKASFVKVKAMNKLEAAATKMFQLYNNLLFLDAKYSWNKIVQEQTEANPFKDLHGVSRKGPRGLTRESFNNCVMFHLLTVFPNNAAEQEKYYLSNVLKKPQRVGVHQFVQHVEQPLLVLQPKLCHRYDAGKHSVHQS